MAQSHQNGYSEANQGEPIFIDGDNDQNMNADQSQINDQPDPQKEVINKQAKHNNLNRTWIPNI